MTQTVISILIGAAGFVILIAYTFTEKKRQERFRKELIEEFRDGGKDEL